jgi:molybdopterin molybdotransferase
MISLESAQKIVLDSVRELGVEKVLLTEALDRVSGKDIFSPIDIPDEDRAGCDGYALKHDDIKGLKDGATVALKVVGTLTASVLFNGHLKRGEAVRVMTGAILPKGCDTAIKQETTKREGEEVFILEKAARGANIRMRGNDLKKGHPSSGKGSGFLP